jgi:hypothetical protein
VRGAAGFGGGFGFGFFFCLVFRAFRPVVIPNRRNLLMIALRLIGTWNSLDNAVAMSRIDRPPVACRALSLSTMPSTLAQ